MDVRCDRCSTEYEFDDALVSERGTSVRCTNCGHQFKVWKPATSGTDSWTVRTADGREFVFYSLRELQRAILGKQVQRSDQLVRGSERRVLGGIPELVTFFGEAEKAGSVPPPRPQFPTPIGLGAPPPASQLSRQGSMPEAQRTGPPIVSLRQIQELDPPTIPIPMDEPEPATTRKYSEPPPKVVQRSAPPVAQAPLAASYDDFDEPPPPRPKGRGGIVFAAVVGVVVVGAGLAVVASRMTATEPPPPQASAAPAVSAGPNAKVADLVSRGERALAEGDLDGAREALIRASALDEHAPRVAVALAQLAAVQGDVAWLRLKLLPATAADARTIAKAQLDDLAKRARDASALAKKLAPTERDAARVEVDTLRLSGSQADAKKLAATLTPSSPDAAYSLAAVEMGEPEPAWSTVVERLKLAVVAETTPGRARAALVFALTKTGDMAGAKAELDKMSAVSRPYPLLAELRALVEKEPRDAGADAALDGGPARPLDVTALPGVAPQPGGAAPVAAAPGGAAPPAAPPAGGDDYSEAELQKRLFGDHGGKAPAPKAPPPSKKPDIDTSDLPGVAHP